MHAGDEVDEIAVDGNLSHLITQQGKKTKDKHLVMGEELADIGTALLVL